MTEMTMQNNGKRIVFSVNGAWSTGYPYGKRNKFISHHTQSQGL